MHNVIQFEKKSKNQKKPSKQTNKQNKKQKQKKNHTQKIEYISTKALNYNE